MQRGQLQLVCFILSVEGFECRIDERQRRLHQRRFPFLHGQHGRRFTPFHRGDTASELQRSNDLVAYRTRHDRAGERCETHLPSISCHVVLPSHARPPSGCLLRHGTQCRSIRYLNILKIYILK